MFCRLCCLGLFVAIAGMPVSAWPVSLAWGNATDPGMLDLADPASAQFPVGGANASASVIQPAMVENATGAKLAANYEQTLEFLGVTLTTVQEGFLETNRFLLLPLEQTLLAPGELGAEGDDEMLAAFDAVGQARLATPDVALHALRRYLAMARVQVEREYLAPRLEAFLRTARDSALRLRDASPAATAARYEWIAAQLTVPLVLLEAGSSSQTEDIQPRRPGEGDAVAMGVPAANVAIVGDDELTAAMAALQRYAAEFSDPLRSRMIQELGLVYGGSDRQLSPLFGRCGAEAEVDYALYTPRGGYEHDPTRRAFFRAMAYLRRNGFSLLSVEGVADALCLSCVLAAPPVDGQGEVALQLWREIRDATALFEGPSLDVTYEQWREFLARELGMTRIDPSQAGSPALARQVLSRLDLLEAPASPLAGDATLLAADGETSRQDRVFRLFGAPFRYDSWIVEQLADSKGHPDVALPETATALFIPAVFGDETARRYVARFIEQGGRPPATDEVLNDFASRLDAMAAIVNSAPEDAWTRSLDAAWLRLLAELRTSCGPGYPLYMQSPLFTDKQLQTYLGSYAELTSDTFQAGTETASPGSVEPGERNATGTPGRGFVEPLPELWDGVARLASWARRGLQPLGAPRPGEEDRLARFVDILELYQRIAAQELQGGQVAPEDWRRLGVESLGFMAAPLASGERQNGVTRVAAVHRDGLRNEELYEATAQPYVMLAVAGDRDEPRLVVGLALNHYEFTRPLAEGRMTDKEWRRLVYEDPRGLPGKNFWLQGLLLK